MELRTSRVRARSIATVIIGLDGASEIPTVDPTVLGTGEVATPFVWDPSVNITSSSLVAADSDALGRFEAEAGLEGAVSECDTTTRELNDIPFETRVLRSETAF